MVLSFVYAATTYYTDLPTASSGSTLTSANWNNLVNYTNKAVKQETEVLTVTGGSVGIGTTSPGSSLTINGNAYTHINGGNSNTAPWLASLNNALVSSATYGWSFYNNATNGNLDLYRNNGSTTTNQVMSFDRTTGNVGIGLPNPDQLFTVNGNARATTVLVGASAGGTYLNTTNQG